jgi:ribonucleoside-triphosphate reductase
MNRKEVTFKLTDSFVESYATKTPPFGFNGLGELVYLRTYSRLKEDGTQEQWHETVRRVVEGTYTMQKRWITEHNLGWSDRKAQRSAQEMFDRIWNMKFLPPGRGLWAMGSSLTMDKDLYAALNNCAFVSTENLAKDLADPFTFLMDASMLGIGVGFDTKGAGQLTIQAPRQQVETFVIADTREGWVDSLGKLLESYFVADRPKVTFDYSNIRAAGEPIKGFGGVASGAEPLKQMHEAIRAVLEASVGQPISVRNIVDIQNLIGKCVVAGNVRRTAEIAFGAPDSEEFLDLKNYNKNPERAEYGWTSNNSIFAELGMDYAPSAERVALNGEPGYAWLENMRAYGRMGDAPDFKDKRVAGANPCVEQSLESYELCCLVETFPANHDSLEDYRRTLKFAYLYGKTVTLGKTPWARTNRVLLRNRRIGLSQSGIQQAVAKLGIEEYRKWCEVGYKTVRYYDDVYSEWLTIPKSIKVTSVKPSGSVSLLAGATPGMHWPEATTYIRRMRLSKFSDLIEPLRAAGYPLEPAYGSEESTLVVEIPVKIHEPLRTTSQVSMWEQLSMAAFLQKYWADNQVSATITFDPTLEGQQISHALQYFQYQLKGVSFLPKFEAGAYKQMPYEGINEAEYQRRVAALGTLNFGATHEKAEQEKYCDGASCAI